MGKQITPEDCQKIKALTEVDVKPSDIAKLMNRNAQTIKDVINRGFVTTKRGRLSDDEITEIKRLNEEGYSVGEISKKISRAERTIYKIIARSSDALEPEQLTMRCENIDFVEADIPAQLSEIYYMEAQLADDVHKLCELLTTVFDTSNA